jgi:hypothetical protein
MKNIRIRSSAVDAVWSQQVTEPWNKTLLCSPACHNPEDNSTAAFVLLFCCWPKREDCPVPATAMSSSDGKEKKIFRSKRQELSRTQLKAKIKAVSICGSCSYINILLSTWTNNQPFMITSLHTHFWTGSSALTVGGHTVSTFRLHLCVPSR